MPTEAEWEYAARGGQKSKGYKFSGSDNLEELASGHGSEVGIKKPNELGICDMTGNLAELCYDFWDRNYYENVPNENPKGPPSEDAHVIKGGLDSNAKLGTKIGAAKTYSRSKGFSDKVVEYFSKTRLKKSDIRHSYAFRLVYISDK